MDCQTWLRDLSEKWREKLVSFGLIEGSKTPKTLKAFAEFVIKEYYDQRKQPGTVENWNQSKSKWLEYFDGDVLIRSITTGDLKLFRRHLEKLDYSTSTIGGHLSKLRTLMNRARDHQLIDTSPFVGFTIVRKKDKEKKVYVPVATIKKLMMVCNPYWQAAICLVRFGGMRAPSDVFGLTWDRVDFVDKKIVAARQKTKRDITIPMSPEIHRTLSVLWDHGEPGEFVFPSNMVAYRRRKNKGSYAQLRRLIFASKQVPWPVLWNSLRSSWSQDLKEAGISKSTYSRWLDHSEKVETESYDLGPGDREFDRVIKLDSGIFSGD